MHFEAWQWVLGVAAALMIGTSKTGVPGLGILIVPMLATAFGGRLSVGVMLPMLIVGDIFAVTWYRRHTQWDKLVGLLPWVVVGMAAGTFVLWLTGGASRSKDYTDLIIGCLVLAMVALHLLRGKLGDSFAPTSSIGVAGTGVAAGFATTVSNAAGPVMQMYFTAHKLPKHQFMGTTAWYFCIVNMSKFPIYVVMSRLFPTKPLVTTSSLTLNLVVLPAIIAGVYFGRWLLPRIPQKTFERVVIALATVGAVKMIAG